MSESEHDKAFREACYKGDLDKAKELVEKHNVNPNRKKINIHSDIE